MAQNRFNRPRIELIGRICADLIREYPSNPRNPWSIHTTTQLDVAGLLDVAPPLDDHVTGVRAIANHSYATLIPLAHPLQSFWAYPCGMLRMIHV